MPAILSRLSSLFINYLSCDLDNTKILLYKLFVQYLVVKPACINAALAYFDWHPSFINLTPISNSLM